MRKDLKYWITLSTHSNLGAKAFLKLQNISQDMEEIWRFPLEKLRHRGLEEKVIQAIAELRRTKNPDQELEKVQKLGISVIAVLDQRYPRLLKEIPDPPAVLYIRGELRQEDDLAVAVVGSREYTYYGRQCLEKLVPPLIESGVTIVSGLALGIDGYAHREALKNPRSRTIAVLPTGVDRIYPACHKSLAEEIINGRGAVISEFPLGTQSYPNNFPIRNRIIAGLSLGTLVIEASLKSGSFLTAKSSLEYNREVFAVPGSIFSTKSEGTNGLIKMGAKMVTNTQDIFDELNINTKKQEGVAKQIIADSKEEEQILAVLDREKAEHVDKIVKNTNIDISILNSTLVIMEMKGKVRNIGGNLYIKR